MTVVELAERCEQAAGPDRRLDCEIEAAIGKLKGEFRVVKPPFYDAERYFSGQEGVDWIGYDLLNVGPHHTSSIDAATTLVPKGFIWVGGVNEMGAGFTVTRDPNVECHASLAATPALALCAAALRAHAAIADTHPKGGDGEAAPSLMSGGGAEGNRPNTVRQQREGKR